MIRKRQIVPKCYLEHSCIADGYENSTRVENSLVAFTEAGHMHPLYHSNSTPGIY